MTTRERIDLLARAEPELFPRKELVRLAREQLGSVDALAQWTSRDGVRRQPRAPRCIYHICAGNLAVSALTSLAHGLILGSHNLVKLPGDRHDDSVRREIVRFVQRLPASLRRLVEIHRTLDERLLQDGRVDVVVAFGTSETIEALQQKTQFPTRFIAHGPAISLLYVPDPARLTVRQARACAVDVLTYDQLGCLSPQAIYVPTGTDIPRLAAKLAAALEHVADTRHMKPSRPLAVAARIAEARDVAHALGHRVWMPPRRGMAWTLIHHPNPVLRPSPLHGVITLQMAGERQLRRALSGVAGRISTVGVAGQISSRLQALFLTLGASRFCPAGRMQFPPLTWHHDGRPALAELVTWVDSELPR